MLSFYMPTKIIYDDNVISKNSHIFKTFGNKALIVTGKHSAYKNGSLKDIQNALTQEGIAYEVFDKIMENPTLEIIDESQKDYMDANIDFVIGIGGGSPLDAAKGIALVLNNPTISCRDTMSPNTYQALPVIAVATTAGTGSETTPYAIFTDHEQKTKVGCQSKVFPDYALLDPKYFKHMPEKVLKSTAIDALCHVIEGYLCMNSGVMSDLLAEKCLTLFNSYKHALLNNNLSDQNYQNMILNASLAGIIISQTGTSLPHAFGYYLTYEHQVPHGFATAAFIGEYFSFHQNKEKVMKALNYMGFESIQEFKSYLRELIGPIEVPENKIDDHIQKSFANKRKMDSHPFPVELSDVERFFTRSVKIIKN